MATDRLTRQELSWLLAQEARSAAHLLRKGVSGIKPEETPAITDVSSTLDALDDAVKTLATLQASHSTHTRRGRIDLAALLLELAPHAALSLEPGSGTEVFAEESELRRMLQVLLSMGAPEGAEQGVEIRVKRQGEDIRVEVALGPDSSGAARMEQAWLHRMAVRHGGRLALGGGLVALELPADVDADRREVQELRRELAAAQEQGEMYAREIATMFAKSGGDSTIPPAPVAGPKVSGPSLVALSGALVAALRPDLQALSRGLASGEVEGAQGRVHVALAILEDLDRYASAQVGAMPGPCALDAIATAAAQEIEARADRRGVRVEVALESMVLVARRQPLEALLFLLLSQAVEASPVGGLVKLSGVVNEQGCLFLVDDGGAAVPIGARGQLLSLEADGTALGRPRAAALGLAWALAGALGVSLSLEDAPDGGLRVQVGLPAAG